MSLRYSECQRLEDLRIAFDTDELFDCALCSFPVHFPLAQQRADKGLLPICTLCSPLVADETLGRKFGTPRYDELPVEIQLLGIQDQLRVAHSAGSKDTDPRMKPLLAEQARLRERLATRDEVSTWAHPVTITLRDKAKNPLGSYTGFVGTRRVLLKDEAQAIVFYVDIDVTTAGRPYALFVEPTDGHSPFVMQIGDNGAQKVGDTMRIDLLLRSPT